LVLCFPFPQTFCPVRSRLVTRFTRTENSLALNHNVNRLSGLLRAADRRLELFGNSHSSVREIAAPSFLPFGFLSTRPADHPAESSSHFSRFVSDPSFSTSDEVPPVNCCHCLTCPSPHQIRRVSFWNQTLLPPSTAVFRFCVYNLTHACPPIPPSKVP